MAQFGRPNSDDANGGWSRSGGGTPLYEHIDEESPNDSTDYVWCFSNNKDYDAGMTSLTDPGVSTGHIIRVRARSEAGTPDATFVLLEGTTEIATCYSGALTTIWTTYSHTLSAAEADSITDYTNLGFRLGTDVTTGDTVDVTWAEFEVPDAAASGGGGSLLLLGVG